MDSIIREMRDEEVRQLVSWAGREGWNPGCHDADLFLLADPRGFLAVEEGGEFCGGGAIIRYGGDFGFMGLFIVEEDCRGRGLGAQLWMARRDTLRARLGPQGTIALDGVDAMVPFYERGGFRRFTRHRRFEISPDQFAGHSPAEGIVPLAEISAESVDELDRSCFPGPRAKWFAYWIRQQGAVSLGCTAGGRLQAFGVMRPCLVGWKIGPLFAETEAAAEALFAAFMSKAGEGPVFLDAPDNNPDALALCRRHSMTEVFGCERMYLGPEPKLNHRGIYGVTTLEIG